MKYLCLVYLSPEKWNACPDSTCAAYGQQLQRQRALHRAARRCIRCTPPPRCACATAQAAVTDGPFAETKEALAGFYLIDARDLNEAIQIAAKIPPAKHGSIEVRPTRELVVEPLQVAATSRSPAH